MKRHAFSCFLLIFVAFSCRLKPKREKPSVVLSAFVVDTTRPAIPSGFYVISDTPTTVKRRYYGFLKETNVQQDYYLDTSRVISFASVSSISTMDDKTYDRPGYFALEMSLDKTATKRLAAITSTARLSGLQLGTVSNNTLVFVARVPDTIKNGKMFFSYVFNEKDVENLKRNFEKAVSEAKKPR